MDIHQRHHDDVRPGDNQTRSHRYDDYDYSDNDDEYSSRNDYDIPVDSGWAWVVALASFLIYLTTCSYFFAVSVLFDDICDNLNTSATAVTAMMALMNLAFCIVNQVSVNLMHAVSIRLTATLAAIVNCLATLVLACVPHLSVYMICSVIKFATHGALQVPGLTMVGLHFRRKRGVANGLAILGMSISSIVCPPLVQYWRDLYGFHGALLILAGFEAHCIIATLLLRPLNSYPKKKKPNSLLDNEKNTYGAVLGEKFSNLSYTPAEKHHTNGNIADANQKTQNGDTVNMKDPEYQLPITAESLFNVSNIYSLNNNHFSHDDSKDKETDSMLYDAKSSEKTSEKPHHDHGKLHHDHGLRKFHNVDLCASQKLHENEIGSMLSSVYSISRLSTHSKQKPDWKSKCMAIVYTFIDLSVFSKKSTLMYLICFSLCYSYMYFITYIPSYGKEMGLTSQSASILVTVYGIVDIFSKLGFGFFGDSQLVRPSRVIAVSSMAAGIMCLLSRFYATFWEFVIFVAAFSMLGSTSYTMNVLLIVESVGEKYLEKLMGMGMMFATIWVSITLPIQGHLKVISGTFSMPLIFIGGCLVVGGVLLILLPLVTHRSCRDPYNDSGDSESESDGSELEKVSTEDEQFSP